MNSSRGRFRLVQLQNDNVSRRLNNAASEQDVRAALDDLEASGVAITDDVAAQLACLYPPTPETWLREYCGFGYLHPEFHLEMLDKFEDNPRRLGYFIPRGTMKSSVLTVGLGLREAIFRHPALDKEVYGNTFSILILSWREKSVKEFMGKIKDFCEQEENIRRFPWALVEKPTQKGFAWSTEKLEMANGCTVYGLTFSAAPTGLHADLIIADDCETLEGMTPQERERAADRWALLSSIENPGGRRWLVGTFFDRQGLNYLISQRTNSWVVHRKSILDEDGNSLWVERFPNSLLEEIKEDQGHRWWCSQYLLELPETLDDSFHPSWIQMCDSVPGNTEGQTFVVCDLAIAESDKKGNAYTAILVVQRVKQGSRVLTYVKHLDRGRGWETHSPSKTADRIIHLAEKYDAQMVVLESVGYQLSMKDLLQTRMNASAKWIQIETVKRGRTRENKLDYIKKLQPDLSAKNIWIYERMDYKPLVEEIENFPLSNPIDCLDALSMLWTVPAFVECESFLGEGFESELDRFNRQRELSRYGDDGTDEEDFWSHFDLKPKIVSF